MFFLRDLSNGKAALFDGLTCVNSIQSIRVSCITNRWQKFVGKHVSALHFMATLHSMATQSNFHFKAMLDLFSRRAMQPKETTTWLHYTPWLPMQSNFHFKAMLDLFSRRAMQPKETTMALLHNSQTWLLSVH